MSNPLKNKMVGFTLLEILIALFIFTIVSMLLVGALHTVMTAASRTESNASRLRQMQITLLLMSRDIEQAVNRPAVLSNGRQEAAFIGSPTAFTFTHLGKGLQRTRYEWKDKTLSRITWLAVDQSPDAKMSSRQLLTNVIAANFEYLDKSGRFQKDWPKAGETSQFLPRAVRINFTIQQWGTVSQLYVIAAENKDTNTSAKPAPAESPEL